MNDLNTDQKPQSTPKTGHQGNFLLKIHTMRTLRGVRYDELCRIAAHNLSERRNLAARLANAGKSSRALRMYVSRQLGELTKERQIIQKKEKQIQRFKTDLDRFLI